MNKKFPNFKETPGVLMERLTALAMHFKFLEENQPIDINNYTLDELIVLFELLGEEGLCQNQIADKIHKNKSTIKRTLDKLEKKGAITKEKDKVDSRKYNIYLSEETKALKSKFAKCVEDDTKWFKECLGEKGYKSFMEQLNFLYKQIPARHEKAKEIFKL